MMHKKNQTSFAQGNQWRFSENCQPIRKMTGKQTLKAIDNLISMSQNEITDVFNNEDAPLFLRKIADRILAGDISYVAELRAHYNNSL